MKTDDYSYCQVIGITDRGLKRAANEDWLGEKKTPNGWVAVVCDGMGGHVGGATASHIAVEAILDFLSTEYFDDARIAIGKAIDKAHIAIRNKVALQPELDGMGATCLLLIVRDGKVYIGHVGDSRIYLIRDHRIHQLTKDHSYVQMLVDMGEITPEQAEHHPRKNEITNALGIPQMQPATVMQNPIEPQAGDCFLMCSDGLSGMVDNKTIEHVVSQQQQLSAQERAVKLVEKAKEGGGLDNITVQLVEFGATPSSVNEQKAILKQWWFWTTIVVVCCAAMALLFIPRTTEDIQDVNTYSKKENTISLKNLQAHNDTIMLLIVNGSSDTCSLVLKDANNVYLETLNNVVWRSPLYPNKKIVVNYDAMPVEGKINGIVRLINTSESKFFIQFEAKDCIYIVEVDIDKPQSAPKQAISQVPTTTNHGDKNHLSPLERSPSKDEKKHNSDSVSLDSLSVVVESVPVVQDTASGKYEVEDKRESVLPKDTLPSDSASNTKPNGSRKEKKRKGGSNNQ